MVRHAVRLTLCLVVSVAGLVAMAPAGYPGGWPRGVGLRADPARKGTGYPDIATW